MDIDSIITHTHSGFALQTHICIIKNELITNYSFLFILPGALPCSCRYFFFRTCSLDCHFSIWLSNAFFFFYFGHAVVGCCEFKRVFFFARVSNVYVGALYHMCLCLVNRKPDGYLNEDLWELFSSSPLYALKGRT